MYYGRFIVPALADYCKYLCTLLLAELVKGRYRWWLGGIGTATLYIPPDKLLLVLPIPPAAEVDAPSPVAGLLDVGALG